MHGMFPFAPIQVVGKEGSHHGVQFVVKQMETSKYAGYIGDDPKVPEEMGKPQRRYWYKAGIAQGFVTCLEEGKIHDNIWVD